MSATSMAIFSNPLFATYSVYARNASIRECDIIIRVFYARLTEWDRKLIPEMRWCIAKWAIGDS